MISYFRFHVKLTFLIWLKCIIFQFVCLILLMDLLEDDGFSLDAPKIKLFNEKTSEFQERMEKIKAKEKVYKSSFSNTKIPMSLTFNDVLMVPQYSEVNSRSQCSIDSHFSHNIPLKVPIISSPMDTVTEYRMAIEMARQGGLGILHRFLTIDEQVDQVEKVKRAGVFMNPNPVTISEDATFKEVKQLKVKYNISSFLVIQKKDYVGSPRLTGNNLKKIAGILTARDINCFQFNDQTVKEFMTPLQKLIYYEVEAGYSSLNCDLNTLLAECKKLLYKNKIEKIPVLNPNKEIIGLVSLKDILQFEDRKYANKDSSGRLFIGAAVGANKDYLERAQRLSDAGCDVLVVDVANGHSKLAMDATQELKEKFPTIDVVSGSVASGQGAENLIRSGADGIRCGIGNGSICITRIVAGSGVPQLSALIDTVPVCREYGVPLCSDGGNKNSGNMCKALAMGADSIMVARLVAGCEQSPGLALNKDGKFIKIYRGMAGLGANLSKQQRSGGELNPQTFSSEGVEGYIPFTGPLQYVIQGFASGIRSGMSYSGAFNLKQLREKVQFVQITNSGFKESNVHGITKME